MTAPSTPPHLLFVIVEDWFFVSHFLPLARAAMAAGFAVTIATRIGSHRETIERTGARIIALEGDRGALNPFAIAREAAALRVIFKAENPDIVHLIGLRPILAGSLAARLAGIRRRLVALTGLGVLGAASGAKGAAVGFFLRGLKVLAQGPDVRFVFENRTDPTALGLSVDDPNVTIVGGAGVDPDRLTPAPLPADPPLRVAMVSRMLWSKGVDTAVEAVTRARALGANIELSLFGAPDPANPRALSEETLRQWAARPGIAWHGRTDDVAAVWAAHHLAIQPSRGGEGLPRTLLEAAACGRGILTTDVPGCRDFVRNGIDGMLVPPGDVEALAAALVTAATNPADVARYGAAARQRLLDGHTEAAVAAAFIAVYKDMLA